MEPPELATFTRGGTKFPVQSNQRYLKAKCYIEANPLEIVERPFSEHDTADFTNCIKRGCPYGQEDWVEKTAEALNLQSTLTKRGRPRKYPEGMK